jgi:hypothetical protein
MDNETKTMKNFTLSPSIAGLPLATQAPSTVTQGFELMNCK